MEQLIHFNEQKCSMRASF